MRKNYSKFDSSEQHENINNKYQRMNSQSPKTFWRSVLFSLLLPLLLMNCLPQEVEIPQKLQELENLTVYSADVKPSKTISFQKDAVYSESGEVLIDRRGEVGVDSLGRVFIADIGKKVIYVFAPDGQFIDQVGRDGRGPGEFSSYIKNLQIYGNRLYAFDPAPNRLNVFTLNNLTIEKTISLGQNRSNFQELTTIFPDINNLFVTGRDTFIAEFITHFREDLYKYQNVDVTSLYYSLDYDGNISEKLLEFKSEERTNLLLVISLREFFGHVLHGFSSHSRIFLAEPDVFLVKMYSPEGDYQSAFFYPHKKIPLSKEKALDAKVRETLISEMHLMDLPESWPVLTDMKIDDENRLWIATTVEDMSIYEWWVLEETGELITKFEWPRDEPIEEVKNGYMYTRDTDEETGLQTIVKYEVEMNEK